MTPPTSPFTTPFTTSFMTPRLVPDADEARTLLEQELAKPSYVEAQPSIFERIIGDALRGLARLFDGLGGLGAGPGTLVVAVGAALIIIVAIVLIKPRLNARGKQQEEAVFDDGARRSANHHRSRAAAHAHAGEWNGAVAELLRAVIRSAEERVVIDEQPGRTATEASLQLGAVFPPVSPDIEWLADLFNETHYGSGTATAQDYRRASDVDARLSSERPAQSASPTTLAAPR
ncbi:DUF4129 domain-containing protein [Arthrobacter sp. NamB2]|nr:DUF4129 domain-containing protein [Arthrobacter sp. NamB2]